MAMTPDNVYAQESGRWNYGVYTPGVVYLNTSPKSARLDRLGWEWNNLVKGRGGVWRTEDRSVAESARLPIVPHPISPPRVRAIAESNPAKKRHTEYLAMVKDAARAVADERRRHAGTQGYRGNEERGLEMALRMATSAGFGPDARAAVRAILRTAPTVPVSPGVKWQRDAQRAKRRASGKAMYPAIRNPSETESERAARHADNKAYRAEQDRAEAERDARRAEIESWKGPKRKPDRWDASGTRFIRNPVTAGDDVTKAYQWAKKEAEYQAWQMGPQQLREARDEAMRSRDQADATAKPSQSAYARAEMALKAAEKAHRAAKLVADRDYAIYGWHADDVSTIAQERKRRLESAKSASASEIAALSNPRRRNPHDSRGRYHGVVKGAGNGRVAKIHQYAEGGDYHVLFVNVHRDGEEQVVGSPSGGYKTLAGAERKARTFTGAKANPRCNPYTAPKPWDFADGEKLFTPMSRYPGWESWMNSGGYNMTVRRAGWNIKSTSGDRWIVYTPEGKAVRTVANLKTAVKYANAKIDAKQNPRRNPVEVNTDGLPPKAPRGYVRIYTVNGGDMMETPTRRFDNVVDAVAHATRTRRPYVVVEDVSKERARRYGVG